MPWGPDPILSSENVRIGLLDEYPFLSTWNIRIKQRFQASPGRFSNAFLVSTDEPQTGVAAFVAKFGPARAENSRGVLAEWHAIRLARGRDVPTPSLLVPDVQPRNFLLMEFLEEEDCASTVANGVAPADVFRLIGETLRRLHETPTKGFGDLLNPGGRWDDSIRARIEPKLQALDRIWGSEIQTDVRARILEAESALTSEPNQPVLIHRDVYLSNFLINSDFTKSTIIDFGMACGGRPFYDLAKLYILDLYWYPETKDSFLGGYFDSVATPESFQPLLKLYLFVELLGMIRFFHQDGQALALQHAKTVLRELLDGEGRIVELIS